MKATNKAGFTLIELMVVAIIVAILAAVAIPLMSANKKRAWATEAQAGCSAIKTAMRVLLAENGAYPIVSGAIPQSALKGIASGDLDGTYFVHGDYNVSSTTSNFLITVTGSKAPLTTSDTLVMTNDVNNVTGFGGTLLQ